MKVFQKRLKKTRIYLDSFDKRFVSDKIYSVQIKQNMIPKYP